jgi:hypothetical protein
VAWPHRQLQTGRAAQLADDETRPHVRARTRGRWCRSGDCHTPCQCRDMNGRDFDLTEHLDELRSHSTEWLHAHRGELVREQRQLRVRELAVTRILDERGAASVDVVASGTTVREAREAVEVSRALADLPAIAAVAHAGELSWGQLKPLVEVATPETDREWAERGKGIDPADLARIARHQNAVTAEDAAARREAREFRWWWRPDSGGLAVRGELPDVDGALVKSRGSARTTTDSSSPTAPTHSSATPRDSTASDSQLAKRSHAKRRTWSPHAPAPGRKTGEPRWCRNQFDRGAFLRPRQRGEAAPIDAGEPRQWGRGVASSVRNDS